MTLDVKIESDNVDYIAHHLDELIKTLRNTDLMLHYKNKHGRYWVQGIRDVSNRTEWQIDLTGYNNNQTTQS